MPKEEWKQIDEFPRYEVSSLGRIRSNIGNEKILGWVSKNGYKRVRLSAEPKEPGEYRTKDFEVHRLVAQYFCEGYSNSKEVHHKDLNRQNNKADNLLPLTKEEHIELHKRLRQQEKNKINKNSSS